MKALFKPLFAIVLATITFTSCMEDDDTDYEAEQLAAERYADSVLSAEKPKIEEYLALNPGGWQEDDQTLTLSLMGKTIKRGFWFEILEEPTAEDDAAYEYELESTGSNLQLVYPQATINYTATLLNGTQVQQEYEANFSTLSSNTSVFNYAWYYSFFPKTIQYSGVDYTVGGFTAKGLKKGSKIRVVSPSYFAFGESAVGSIPANSPLVYEFEVLDIE